MILLNIISDTTTADALIFLQTLPKEAPFVLIASRSVFMEGHYARVNENLNVDYG